MHGKTDEQKEMHKRYGGLLTFQSKREGTAIGTVVADDLLILPGKSLKRCMHAITTTWLIAFGAR